MGPCFSGTQQMGAKGLQTTLAQGPLWEAQFLEKAYK